MKHVTAFLVVALALVAGCRLDDADAIRQALPTAEAVQIKLPGGGQAGMVTTHDGVGASQDAVLGATADFYAFTRQISGTLNGGAAWVLILVHTVVAFPP